MQTQWPCRALNLTLPTPEPFRQTSDIHTESAKTNSAANGADPGADYKALFIATALLEPIVITMVTNRPLLRFYRQVDLLVASLPLKVLLLGRDELVRLARPLVYSTSSWQPAAARWPERQRLVRDLGEVRWGVANDGRWTR